MMTTQLRPGHRKSNIILTAALNLSDHQADLAALLAQIAIACDHVAKAPAISTGEALRWGSVVETALRIATREPTP